MAVIVPDNGLGRSRISRAEALAMRLETEITNQALRPGVRLGTKSQLRERFGVALATINEAVRLMESRGLVAARPGPGGGVFVASAEERIRLSHVMLGLDLGKATFGDCVEVRSALEPLVCRHAARHVTEEVVDGLASCVDRMEASLDDVAGYLAANWEFHRLTASLCRNVPLRNFYLAMIDFLKVGLDDIEFEGHDESSIAVHRELAAAIAEGEGPRLEAAIQNHSERSPLPMSPKLLIRQEDAALG